MHSLRWNVLAALFACTSGWLIICDDALPAAETVAAPVEFNRDIRPILSDNCFQCHGPDQKQRKADLRLDTEEGALADLGGRRAIVPGKLADSELYQRLIAEDANERMPPAKSGKKLTPQQIELVRGWIESGAKWQKHWSLITPERPAVPQVKNSVWVRNPIDAFILSRLEREGLSPSPEADKTTLIRRVTLDLTGLPPTPEEVERFVNDAKPQAYEELVDRLLASPRFGERMAVRWLDAARYADTNGYQSDGIRYMWRWRDWVIDAFNNNMPFDQFTIEQLAGDLLLDSTLDQRIATGFNRNHRGNAEGGIIPEEYAVEYVVDRVDTTSTVWLGLTLGCARCHDHKFDPVTQKEFYQLYAYFNNVPEKGRAIKFGNSPPMIAAPTAENLAQLAKIDRDIATAENHIATLEPQIRTLQTTWEEKTLPHAENVAEWEDGPVAWFPLDVPQPSPIGNQINMMDGDAIHVAGRVDRALEFDGRRYGIPVTFSPAAEFGYFSKFTLSAWINPAKPDAGTIVSHMTDVEEGDGYSLRVINGKLELDLTKRWLDDALRVESETALSPGKWRHVLVTYDGTRLASGVKMYLDGAPVKTVVLLDELNQDFKPKAPFRVGAGNGPEGRFHGLLDDIRIYDRVLSKDEVGMAALAESVKEIAQVPVNRRTVAQTNKLRRTFLDHSAPDSIREADRMLTILRRRRAEIVESFPTTMVMEEMPVPRETHVLLRGEYDKPGEKVWPGVPASLPPLPRGAESNRLGFAKWLVDPANPLTARVAVNRYWQMCFGTGIVKTVDDFGSQGEWPSHPELLDWLATEFVSGRKEGVGGRDSGVGEQSAIRNPQSATSSNPKWNVKALLRLIVTSAAYRQSSKVVPTLVQRDPENRLLARGPRVRLSAEMVRDQALFASGLLVEKIGGPSVRPYQPPGLWKELTGAEDYTQDHGENLYRRSLYTFWKRTVAPPTMLTFDAAGRETCVVRETRTNTPLQALTLLNEVTFVEAARVLAARVMKEVPGDRISRAFQLVTARRPTAAELKILEEGFSRHLARYREDSAAALALITTGESHRDEKLDPAELAAYTAITGLILNLDEAITKE